MLYREENSKKNFIKVCGEIKMFIILEFYIWNKC